MTARAFLVAALVAAAAPAFAQQSQTFDRAVKVGAGAEIIVRNVSGDTRIAGSATGQVEIHAIKRAATSSRIANTDIDVTSTANRVEIRVESRNHQGNTASVDFDIRVPPDGSVDVQTVSGGLHISNVKGALRSETVSGRLTVEAAGRIAKAKSVSGDINVTNGGGDATAEFATVSGNMTMTGFTAHEASFNTVSGDVRLSDASAERISFRSVSGAFEYSGALSPGGRYDLESHSGDIRLAIPDHPGFEVDASTFSGNVVTDYSIGGTVDIRGRGRGRSVQLVRGTYGDGSASLHLRTFSGDMRVTRR